MTLQSMTGFARIDGALNGWRWHWEVRSVNGRGLDLRLRLPPGRESLDQGVREEVAKRLTRGSVTVALQASRETGQVSVRLNEAVLEQVVRAAERVRQLTGAELPRVEGLLALKGVLEVVEAEEDEQQLAALCEAMMADLVQALDQIVVARRAEGRRLRAVIEAQLGEIDRLVRAISASPTRSPEAVRARLADLVAKLVDTGQGLDQARLHQEAVMLATRADIEEEVKRLGAHLEAARGHLDEPGAVGRKLDFLAQEFHREANTLTSKANDAEIARAGLALKTVIDQMREQVANIE